MLTRILLAQDSHAGRFCGTAALKITSLSAVSATRLSSDLQVGNVRNGETRLVKNAKFERRRELTSNDAPQAHAAAGRLCAAHICVSSQHMITAYCCRAQAKRQACMPQVSRKTI